MPPRRRPSRLRWALALVTATGAILQIGFCLWSWNSLSSSLHADHGDHYLMGPTGARNGTQLVGARARASHDQKGAPAVSVQRYSTISFKPKNPEEQQQQEELERGNKENQKPSEQNERRSARPFFVDILSVASDSRPDFWKAQRDTFATHVSVRHFWHVTEADDADPGCAEGLSWEDVTQISDRCRSRRAAHSAFRRTLTRSYARSQYLAKKENPAGWMCAQQRPFRGVYEKALKTYKQGHEDLPDYLLVIDDDTYVNLELFERHFGAFRFGEREEDHAFPTFHRNSSEASAVAGCMVRSPKSHMHFTIPYGGYGYFLSTGSLKRLMEPITGCGTPTEPKVCGQLFKQNLMQESTLFQDGMSLGDLFHELIVAHPYRRHNEWKPDVGFCLHSDWLWGYLNFYNISEHVLGAKYQDVPQSRLEAYLESRLYAGNVNGPGRRNCDLEKTNCHLHAPVCHYSTPDRMRVVTDSVRAKYPTKFKRDGGDISLKRILIDVALVGVSPSVAQRELYGSHPNVREFRTRKAPYAKECTTEEGKAIHSFCKKKGFWSKSTSGSDCNHDRQIGLEFARAVNSSSNLPDYLVVVFDNRTYYNLFALPDYLRIAESERKGDSVNAPLAIAGCLEAPEDEDSYPSFRSEFGLILNRGAMARLLAPLESPSECDLVRQDRYGEAPFFEKGMSLLDLLVRVATSSTQNVAQCRGAERLVSAWLSYFDGSQERTLQPLTGSTTGDGLPDEMFCRNSDVTQCPPESLVCSGLSDDEIGTYAMYTRNL